MKFTKQNLILLVILIIGIAAINTFMISLPENNCACWMPDPIKTVICSGSCPSGDCEIRNLSGRCEGTTCVTTYKRRCLDAGIDDEIFWEEPSCYDCLGGAM